MRKAYTLIEVLVAIAIFFIVVAAPTGFFVTSLKGQRKALASQELLDNASYTLEYISRALRMAKKDKVGDCVTPGEGNNYKNYEKTSSRNLAGIAYSGPGIRFKNYQSDCQEFFLDENDSRLKESNFLAPSPLTSNDLEILSFKIASDESWDQADDLQPRITFSLEIKRKGLKPEMTPKIKIQTTISQRNLDFPY